MQAHLLSREHSREFGLARKGLGAFERGNATVHPIHLGNVTFLQRLAANPPHNLHMPRRPRHADHRVVLALRLHEALYDTVVLLGVRRSI